MNEQRIFQRLQRYAQTKPFLLESAHDESAALVNNLSSLAGQCNNIVDTIAQIEAAKKEKNGDALDKALDTLKSQMNEFTSVGKITKSAMLTYLKPMVRGA